MLLSQTVIPFKLEQFLLQTDSNSLIALKSVKNLKRLGLASTFNLQPLYKHLKQKPLWLCSLCNETYLSTVRHKCISILTCQVPLSNGKKCEFQLSSNNRDNFIHHRYHTFCLELDCSIHSNRIFVTDDFLSDVKIKSISAHLSHFNTIHVDCSMFDSGIEQRNHFISVMSSLCKNLNPDAYQMCNCTNFCLCKRSLFLSEPTIIKSKISKASKYLTSVAKDIEEFKESGEGIRILGFDSFSVSKSRQNKNCKDITKAARICDLRSGVKNFQSASKGLLVLDEDLSILFDNFNRKNIFVMSSDMFYLLKKMAPKHKAFQQEAFICQMKSEGDMIEVKIEHFPQYQPDPPAIQVSKRSLMNELGDSDSSMDFEKPKPKKKKLKQKNEFKAFGKKSMYSSDEDLDAYFN